MPRTFTAQECAVLPTASIEAAARDNFDTLVSCAVADALYSTVRPSTARWLRSPETHLLWLDALRCAEGENQIAAERLAYQQDPRARAVHRRTVKIRDAIAEASALRRRYQREEHRANHAVRRNDDPDHVARIWLRRFHREAYEVDLYQPLLAARGLPPHANIPPFSDVHESIEHACATGLIEAPVSPRARCLLAATDAQLSNVTADDCREQDERDTDLRHPLLLRRWSEAITQLLDLVAPRAHALNSDSLGALDVRALRPLPAQEAHAILNNRRFFCALQQRRIEQRGLTRRLAIDIAERTQMVRQPWADAAEEATTTLAQRHSEQYAYIRERLVASLGTDGGARLHGSSQARAELKRHVFEALAAQQCARSVSKSSSAVSSSTSSTCTPHSASVLVSSASHGAAAGVPVSRGAEEATAVADRG